MFCGRCFLCLLSSSAFLSCEVRVVHFVHYVFLHSKFRVVMSTTIPAYKRCSFFLYPQLFVGGLMSYVLFAYSGGQHSVLPYVVAFYVPCCDVRYDFCIQQMFGSSLLPVVCRRANVIFMLFVFVCV